METRVLLRRDDLVLVQLRFTADGTIDEHATERAIDVVCLEGSGFTSVGRALRGEPVTTPLRAGERMHWPRGVPHRLWTDGSPMTTLMVERV